MKNTLRRLVNVDQTDGDIGIEIEMEGGFLPRREHLSNLWRVTTDGSLRGDPEGLEYVMRGPRNLEGVKECLDDLKNAMNERGTAFSHSIYGGVHVHVNVQELTPRQLYTMMTAYYIIEEVLLTYCGDTRQGNHFCLRGKDAEYGPRMVATSAREKDLNILNDNNLRYAGMNPCSLFNYGSLEFRSMRSTDDFDVLLNWATMLYNLRENSKKFESPVALMEGVSGSGPMAFLESLIGEEAKHFENVTLLDRKLMDGAQLAQVIAYLPDWSKYRDTAVSPFKRSM